MLNWTPIHILWVSILASELGTAMVVSGMSLLFHGEVRQDFIMTGIVAALAVSLPVVSIVMRLMRTLQERTNELQTSYAILHETQEKLLLSGDLMMQAMVRMPIAFIVWNNDFHAIEWNPAAEKIFGYDRTEALKCSPLDLFVPSLARTSVAEAMANLLNGKNAGYSAPGNNITKDGQIISCLWFNAPLKNREGRVYGVLSMVTDVTEREKMDQALRASEQQLQNILNNTSSVVFMKDLQGRYLFINRQYEDLFHISNESIRHKTDYDIFPADRADIFQANDRSALAAETPIRIDEIIPQDDGDHTYISVRFPLLDESGRPYAVCGVATDITERKQIEDALRCQ